MTFLIKGVFDQGGDSDANLGREVHSVVDSICPDAVSFVNEGVPQKGSVSFPTLFIMMMTWSVAANPIHSFAEVSILHADYVLDNQNGYSKHDDLCVMVWFSMKSDTESN